MHNKHKRYERGIEKKKTKKTEWERKMLRKPSVPLFSRRSFWNASKDDDEDEEGCFWCCFFPSTPVGENLKFSDIIIALNIIKRRLLLKSTKEKNEEHAVLRFAALFVPPFIDDSFNKSRVRVRDIIILFQGRKSEECSSPLIFFASWTLTLSGKGPKVGSFSRSTK